VERIAMNQEERDWLDWLKRVQDGVVTQRQAAAKMGVSDRWVRKLLVRMKTDGDAAVVHGLRGRSSNRRLDAQTQARVVELLKRIRLTNPTLTPPAPAIPAVQPRPQG
jgi:prolyl-tRNA editing enzyme YbaK/EbsC (Cys-tRNA(Pro) deacylase)